MNASMSGLVIELESFFINSHRIVVFSPLKHQVRADVKSTDPRLKRKKSQKIHCYPCECVVVCMYVCAHESMRV